MNPEPNPENIRDRLLGAVPPLTVPPDRMAEVSRRVARRRNRRAGVAVLGAAVAAGLVGGTPVLLSYGVSGGVNTGAANVSSPVASPRIRQSPTAGPSGLASILPTPSAPPTVPPASPGDDGVAAGRCPDTLSLVSEPPQVRAAQDDTSVALPLRKVTLCRYRQPTFDWSASAAVRIAGPRTGTAGQFGTPLNQYLHQRYAQVSPSVPYTPSPGASPPTSGCAYPSPQSNIPVDVVYTVDAKGVAREYRVDRTTCANGWVDPARQLEGVVDGVLGPPY